MRYPIEVKELGRKLKEARERAGLAPDQVARMAGVSLTLIRNLENGKTSPSVVAVTRIARALACPLEKLVDHIRAPKDQVDERFQKEIAAGSFENVTTAFAGKVRLDFDSKRSLLELLDHARQRRKNP